MLAVSDGGEEDDYDNGFPSFQLLSEAEDEENVQEDGSVEAKEEGFASDFYRSGTDWSCLLFDNNCSPSKRERQKKKKKLKQTDLFQMWGLNNPHAALSIPKSHDASIHLNSKASPVGKMRDGALDTPPRLCPFYKKIPVRPVLIEPSPAHVGTPFTVDAFRYGRIPGCSAYFLTHFHSDHYGGLSKAWSHAPIYCTPLTARLLRMCLSVNPLFICPLELNTEHVIEGITVTMLEANHCPGAALIHFRLPNAQCLLHTGDFRACKLMQTHPLLVNQRINVLYLDTTYCNPKYKFPSKEDVLSFVVRVTKICLKKQPKTLVVVGAYSIGKECVYLAISQALGVKIYANDSRRRILQSFGWPELSGSLCSHGKDTPLHVLPISSLRFESLKHYLKTYMDQYTAVLAFRPTGWTYSQTIGNQLDLIKPSSKGNVAIYGVPYSEHSSFTELQEFVKFLRPGKIIPTVNVGNAANRDKMQSYFREWLKG